MQKIKFIQGNSFQIAIPIAIKEVTSDNVVTTITSSPYEYEDGDQLFVKLIGERRTYSYEPTIEGANALFTLEGNELAGKYGIEVIILRNEKRLRYASQLALELMPYTGDFDTMVDGMVTLDASIFIIAKGENGKDGRDGKNAIASWQRVRHCIKYNSNTGFVYTGKKMVHDLDGETLLLPCMKFPDDKLTFDLSKLGTEWFSDYDVYEYHGQNIYHYYIDHDNKTITFESDAPNGNVAWLRYPDIENSDDNPSHSHFVNHQVGYYIDKDGALRCTHGIVSGQIVKDFNEPLNEVKLEPITNADEITPHIGFVTPPATYKNVNKMARNREVIINSARTFGYHQEGRALSLSKGRVHRGFEIEILTKNIRFGRWTKTRGLKEYEVVKWVRLRPAYLLGNPKGLSYGDKIDEGWNLVSVPRGFRLLFVRVRRTNQQHTRHSEWTYWKIFRPTGDENEKLVFSIYDPSTTFTKIKGKK